jgi:hypothetical protein
VHGGTAVSNFFRSACSSYLFILEMALTIRQL